MYFLVSLHLHHLTVHIPLVHSLYFKFKMDDNLDPFGFTVEGTDYVQSAADWNGKPFQIKSEKEWRESVHRCYTNVPKETLQRFKFVYNIDSEEQREVKTQAAIYASNWVMEQFEKEYSNVLNHEEVKNMLESQVNYLFCCLQTFLPITTHCKVLEFEEEYPQIPLHIYPFGKGAGRWRRCYSLEFLVEGKA